jgi:hypothetical protein
MSAAGNPAVAGGALDSEVAAVDKSAVSCAPRAWP